MSKLTKLTDQDYEKIERGCEIDSAKGESYVIVTAKHRGRYYRGIHVFDRKPSTREMVDYEKTSSQVHFKGNKAKIEGSTVQAAVDLYGKIIARAYDVVVGNAVVEKLTAEDARNRIDPMTKREAIREFTGNASAQSALEDDDEDDVKSPGDKEED